jgi:hypothetical protein
MSYPIKPEGVTGSGLSGMPTRSDLARARELERHNLDMEWYEEKVVEQTIDGDVICAECSKSETKRLGNGKLRPLAIDARRKRLICQRCASKQRSEKARTHAAKLKEKREEEDQPKSFDEFWTKNREALTPDQLQKLQARNDEITFLYDVIVGYNNGTDETSAQDLRDTVADVLEELKERGTVDCEVCNIPFYRREESDFYNHVLACDIPGAGKHARATATFAKFGLLEALPIFVHFNQVRIFLQKFGPKPRVVNEVTLKCNECGKATIKLSESEARTRFGTEDNPLSYALGYRCASCTEKCDQRAGAAAKQFSGLFQRELSAPENQIFDAWGRAKDFKLP